MSETRKEYIQRVYGCNEYSIDHWDRQDMLHNGRIPGTATELNVPRETTVENKITLNSVENKPKRGRPKKEEKV